MIDIFSLSVEEMASKIKDGQLIKYQGDYKYYKEKKIEEEEKKQLGFSRHVSSHGVLL